MREINYKIWDKKNKEFLVIDGDLLLCWEGYTGWYIWKNGYGEYLEQSEIELSQYTGLKDSSGREIYEGDILEYKIQCHYTPSEYEEMKKDGKVPEVITATIEVKIPHIYDMDQDAEIIGNIYENPELLK